MLAVSEIQPAVITTFALSDLMGQTQKCHAPPAVVESFCISNSAKAERRNEYANKRYGSKINAGNFFKMAAAFCP